VRDNVHTDIFANIVDIDASSWNELVPEGGFYSSYAWTRNHESLYRRKSAFIRVRDGARVMAFAPVGFARHELSHDYSQARFGELFDDTADYAVLGSRRGYRNPWLIRSGLTADERTRVIGTIVDSALQVAADWQVDAVVAPYLTESAMSWLSGSARLRQHRTVAKEAVLDVRGRSFGDYLAPMSNKRRRNILRERARPGRLGLRLQVEPVEPGTVDDLAGLMAQVEAKYGRQVTVEGLRRYLATTFASDPAHARLFTCRNGDGGLISAAMAFEWNRGLYLRATATDYRMGPEDAFAHFNVVYYEPIEYSARRGLDAIYFGTEALQAKVLRGCSAQSLFHAVLRP
jgi:predicted N-acyltransferase